jgi:hypothetical protein
MLDELEAQGILRVPDAGEMHRGNAEQHEEERGDEELCAAGHRYF